MFLHLGHSFLLQSLAPAQISPREIALASTDESDALNRASRFSRVETVLFCARICLRHCSVARGSQVEIAFLMAAAPLGNNLTPLSVQKLTQIRKNQLSLLNQKKLSSNELMRWQETIIAAGHFDAYNYWLFQGARPDEFNQWAKEHQAQYQAWLDWLAKNKFMVQTPDFQRLYLIRGRH